MIDAREVLRGLRLPPEDEAEVQRLGSEVAAALRSPAFDGRPVAFDVSAGSPGTQRDRSYRVACAIQRRFQARCWAVTMEQVPDGAGDVRAYRLWFAIDAAALARSVAPAAKAETPSAVRSPLRSLYDELSLIFGATGAAPSSPPAAPVVSVLFGTYNRLAHLRRAVESVRRAVGGLSYEVVVCDGGSDDGSRAWLAAQPDVLLVGERRLEGAVRAFNQCYALSRGDFVANFNDDAAYAPGALAEAVDYLREHYSDCGQVALPFVGGQQARPGTNDVYPADRFPAVSWGTRYANFGVARREVVEEVARVQGGFWNPCYRTYAADCEFSAWVWRLGYSVDALPGAARVEDAFVEDGLRERNGGGRQASGDMVSDTKRMYARWPAEAFRPDGPPPRVSSEEIARYREVVGEDTPFGEAIRVERPSPVGTALLTRADETVEAASLCDFPEPQEEGRLRAIAHRVRALDPRPGEFPERAEHLSRERVLHVSLCTDADPQAGLVRALKAWGSGGYEEVRWLADYGSDPAARARAVLAAVARLKPTLVFMQLQAPGALDVETVREVRRLADPLCVIATWCGDIARENSPWNVDWQVPLGRACDLVLHSSMTHVRALRAASCYNAGYLQIGFNEEQYKPPPTEASRGDYDVAFLGSRYGQGDDFAETYRWQNGDAAHDAALRDEVVGRMREVFGTRFGLFGNGWDAQKFCVRGRSSIGPCDCPPIESVPLHRAHEVYQRSKVGLSISLDNALDCYTSDRLFRVLGCGALLLVKRFPGMEVLGLRNADNCVFFDTAEDAVLFAQFYVNARSAREHISAAGLALARERHTWGARMLEMQRYVDAVREARK